MNPSVWTPLLESNAPRPEYSYTENRVSPLAITDGFHLILRRSQRQRRAENHFPV